jgi:hypothetical protein
MKGLKHRATVVALLALFVALGGTSLAAANLINGKLIKPNSIPKNRLTKSAIKSLHGAKGAQGAQGPQGAQGRQGARGPKGDTGATGLIGPSNAYSTYQPSAVALGVSGATVASLTLAAGSYVVMAKTTLYIPSGMGTTCKLTDSSAGVIDLNTTSGPTFATPSLLAPLTTSGSTVSVFCASNESDAQASYTHLVAIKLGSVTGS